MRELPRPVALIACSRNIIGSASTDRDTQVSKNSDPRGSGPEPTYAADVKRSEGILVGAGIQFNLFHRDQDAALRLTRLGLFAAVIVVVLAASSVFAASVALTSKTESLGPPEVLLEPGDQPGGNPFMPTPPTVYRPETNPVVADLPSVGGSAAAKPYSGDLPGLYGAPRDRALTDRDDMIAFYTAHPGESNSAAKVLESDSSFTWSGGQHLAGPDLVRYLRELTPVLLRIDLRVTNYGLVDGRAVAHQSILQAGTAVLVDVHGVLRFRSLSGSPLTLPTALPHTPKFLGSPWQGFEAKRVGAVSPSPSPLTLIVLVDIVTGQPFERPVGTTGGGDVDHAGWASTSTPPPITPVTPAPTTSTEPGTPRTTNTPASPLDLSGMWVLENISDETTTGRPNSVVGTMQRTPAGFAFHRDENIHGSNFTWDCTLPDRFGQPVTLRCRQGWTIDGKSDSSDWSCDGQTVTIPWGTSTKLRFDGPCVTTGPSSYQFTIAIRPQ
ncbi:hypothetical protein NS14008_11045 [Nocardia seriolae]|nr:hypothetical protein NS14008_11045 [Nocardia seriolae]PSK32505.1 hypothetical protein C6575_04330 [Nocardia seriolae]RLP30370.1 hypothetical protein D6158_18735 [Nocardia seriolae]BAW08210.1 conserved hypothetical protein [Nocardia seriolae]